MLQHPAFGYQLPECNRISRVRYLVLLFIVQRHFARASGNSHLGAETREKETSKEGWIRVTLHSQGRCFHQLTHWGLGICQCSLKDCSNNDFCLTPWLSRLHLMLFVICSVLFCLQRIFFDCMQVAVGYSFITPFTCTFTQNIIRKCNYFRAKFADGFP